MSDDERPTDDTAPADEPIATASGDPEADDGTVADPTEGRSSDPAVGSEDGEPPPLALPLWKLVAGGVAVLVVVVVAVGAAIFLLGGDDEDDGGGGDEATEEPSIVDSFDRADAADELGSTESDQEWSAESGVWGVQDGQAVLVEPNPDGQRSIAVVDVGAPNATITATAGTMRPGWGIVFRYRGPFNYWFLTASPDYATFNLGRVVDGQVQPLGGVGLADVSDGTVVQVRAVGATIEISVNGNTVKAVSDTTLMGATNAGLLAFGQSAADATWDSFEAVPLPGAAAGGASTPQSVPTPGASTTLAPDGATPTEAPAGETTTPVP